MHNTVFLRIVTLLLVIVSFSLFTPKAFAATTYYISTSGSDTTGNGSISTPWKTLAKACSTISGSGDIIHVNAGTYTETAQCALPVGVSIEGDGVTSIIKSTVSSPYVPIIALNSVSEGTNGNQHISSIKLDGTNLLTSWGISVAGRSNVSIHDITVVDFFETGVSFSGITNPTGNLAPTIYATGNTFYNNTVSNSATGDYLFGRGNFQFGGQDGMLVYNNVITQPYRTAGTNFGTGWPMKMANEGHIKNCKVYNNTLTRAAFLDPAGSGHNNDWNFSFEMWNIESLEMYGNTFQGEVDIVDTKKAQQGLMVYGSTTIQCNIHHSQPMKQTDYVLRPIKPMS